MYEDTYFFDKCLIFETWLNTYWYVQKRQFLVVCIMHAC